MVTYQYKEIIGGLQFEPSAPVVEIRVSYPSLLALQRARTCEALVDSGCDNTTLPTEICDGLGLRRIGQVAVDYGSGLSLEWRFLALVGLPGGVLGQHEVLSWDRPYALLGRDILNSWKLILDGPRQTLEVAV